MKKRVFFIMVLALILLLAGCSDNSSNTILDYVPKDRTEKDSVFENTFNDEGKGKEITKSASDNQAAQDEENNVPSEVSRKKNAVIKSSSLEKNEWEGEWSRNIFHYPGVLEIIEHADGSFEFTLSVGSGGNVGFIEGSADVSGNTAFFQMADSTCEITFEQTDEMIEVVVTEECQKWGGAGTFFEGNYEKGTFQVETDLAKQGILTESENELFQSVVGLDDQLFVQNMMRTGDEEDLDNLNVKVKLGFVQGVAPSMNAIIMINEKFVYAAVPSNEDSFLYYYTNDLNYKDTMPLTIHQWMKQYGYELKDVKIK